MSDNILELGSDGAFDLSTPPPPPQSKSKTTSNPSNPSPSPAPPKPPSDLPSNATFIPSETCSHHKPGYVFKFSESGLGYYKDNYDKPKAATSTSATASPPPSTKTTRKKSKKDVKEKLLDPNHPAFEKMTPEQVESLEAMLKLKPEELKYIPTEQRAMVEQFRAMYKENPDVFKPPKEGTKPPGEKKKKEERKHDPTKWLKDHKESLDWYMANHSNFDKESFLKEEELERAKREAVEKKQRQEREEATTNLLNNMKISEEG